MKTVTLFVIMAASACAADKVPDAAHIYLCGRIQGAIDAVRLVPDGETALVNLLKSAVEQNCEAVRESVGYHGVAGRGDELIPDPPTKKQPKQEQPTGTSKIMYQGECPYGYRLVKDPVNGGTVVVCLDKPAGKVRS